MTFTPEEIIGMARAAGSMDFGADSATHVLNINVLQRFAALVAEKAAAKEREACANSCEDIARVFERVSTVQPIIAQSCAAAIRARGQKGGV